VSYELTVTEKPGYLHVVVTGQNTLDNVAMYLKELTRLCAARGCSRVLRLDDAFDVKRAGENARVLIEENLTGRRLETWDVYQIASEGSIGGSGVFDAIAYVDLNAHGELMKFAKTVANNRGVPLNVFPTEQEAEAWLRNKAG